MGRIQNNPNVSIRIRRFQQTRSIKEKSQFHILWLKVCSIIREHLNDAQSVRKWPKLRIKHMIPYKDHRDSNMHRNQHGIRHTRNWPILEHPLTLNILVLMIQAEDLQVHTKQWRKKTISRNSFLQSIQCKKKLTHLHSILITHKFNILHLCGQTTKKNKNCAKMFD